MQPVRRAQWLWLTTVSSRLHLPMRINEKLAAIPGFPEDGTDALNITSWVLDRPIDAKMAAVRKVLEEEHDLIMIGEEDIDTGIANMNQRAKEARED